MEENFAAFREEIEKEYEAKEEIRSVVRECEQKLREVIGILQKIHTDPKKEAVAAVCLSARAQLPVVKAHFQTLKEKIKPLEFFKYHDLYRFMMQRAVFVTCFLHYLEAEELILLPDAAAALGVGTEAKDGLHLDLDDYLHGVLELAKDMARLSVNAVVVGDFARPRKACQFLKELDAGFRSLNLKNDSLRRRFDALKYDLKKVEEVVYDLSIRNLTPKEPEQEPKPVPETAQ